GKCLLCIIRKFEYKWNDKHVDDYRRDRNKVLVPSEKVGQNSRDKSCRRAENYIENDPRQYIRYKASDKKPRNGGRCEIRQNRQRLGDTELYHAECKVLEHEHQYDV